jgi:hypothetical protein
VAELDMAPTVILFLGMAGKLTLLPTKSRFWKDEACRTISDTARNSMQPCLPRESRSESQNAPLRARRRYSDLANSRSFVDEVQLWKTCTDSSGRGANDATVAVFDYFVENFFEFLLSLESENAEQYEYI